MPQTSAQMALVEPQSQSWPMVAAQAQASPWPQVVAQAPHIHLFLTTFKSPVPRLSIGHKPLGFAFCHTSPLHTTSFPSPSPSLKEAAKYFSLFANTLFSALTTPDTFLNKLIDNHPCDGGCQGINGFPAANQRAPAPAPEPSLARGFCMKGGGACRAAEPSPAERCAPNREGEAGPQAAAGRWGTFVSPPFLSNRSRCTPVRRKWVNSTKTTAPFPHATEYWLSLGYIRVDGAREAGARVGQSPWVVQGDRPTSISGSWQGRR